MTDDELIATLDEASTLTELTEIISLDTLDIAAALLCTLDGAGGVGGLTAPPPPPHALRNETAANMEAIFINEAAVIKRICEHIYVFMVISYMKLIFLYKFIVVFNKPDAIQVIHRIIKIKSYRGLAIHSNYPRQAMSIAENVFRNLASFSNENKIFIT